MIFLPDIARESPEGRSYSEFIWRGDGHPDAGLLEANDTVLKFYGGMEVSSVAQILGETTLSYMDKLVTMTKIAKDVFLSREFFANGKVAAGQIHKEKDVVIQLPNNKILVWDTEKAPCKRNKRVVGFFACNHFSNTPRRPDEVLELYVRAYGNDRLGSNVFCRQYGLTPHLEGDIWRKPEWVRALISDLLKNEMYTTEYRPAPRCRKIHDILNFRGKGRKKELLETLMENHRREVWKEPTYKGHNWGAML